MDKSCRNINFRKKKVNKEPLNDLPIIREISTIFIDWRLGKSFPGDRGIKWYSEKEAVKRLSVFFKNPLEFNTNLNSEKFDFDHSPVSDPIWWFRGFTGSAIVNFEILSETKVLIGNKELEINRIAVCKVEPYYKSYIYVETTPQLSDRIEDRDISAQIEYFGYAFEEYSIFNGRKISSLEHSDGATIIDGEILEIDPDEAKRRIIYLSPYNFIICAKQSPYNSIKFQDESNTIFNEICFGKSTPQKLFEFLSSFNNDQRLIERFNKLK